MKIELAFVELLLKGLWDAVSHLIAVWIWNLRLLQMCKTYIHGDDQRSSARNLTLPVFDQISFTKNKRKKSTSPEILIEHIWFIEKSKL